MTGEECGAEDEADLARALLGALLQRVDVAGDDLDAAGRALELEHGDLSAALSRGAQATHETGWLLALLSEAVGAELLQGRHEARGLRLALGLLAEVHERRGVQLVSDSVPGLRPEGGWRLCWQVLQWVHAHALEAGQGETVRLEWQLGDESARAVLLAPRRIEARADWSLGRFFSEGEASLFELPRNWVGARRNPRTSPPEAHDRYTADPEIQR